MACSTCKHVEIVEPEKSGLQYSLAYGVTTVEGLLGRTYSLKTPLIPKPHTPRGGWGVKLYVYGHANPITGSSASAVFAKCSEFLTLNGFAYTDLDLPASGDTSATISARVTAARAVQTARFQGHDKVRVNADMEGSLLDQVAAPDPEGRTLLARVAERFGLSARGYHRVLRVARTIADLDGAADVRLPHIAEAVSYRLAVGAKSNG